MSHQRGSLGALASGIFFILAGAVFLLEQVGVWDVRPSVIWPLVLVGIGVAVIAGGMEGARDRRDPERT